MLAQLVSLQYTDSHLEREGIYLPEVINNLLATQNAKGMFCGCLLQNSDKYLIPLCNLFISHFHFVLIRRIDERN